MLKLRSKTRGFSLIEVMMAVVLLVILSTLAFITMTGERPKKRLRNTVDTMVSVLNKAQVDAMANATYAGVCIKQDSNGYYMRVYRPALNGAGLPADNDCTSADTLLDIYRFKRDVVICETTCDANVATNKSIFFDKSGYARLQTGAKHTYQVCLINPFLDTGYCAREVEATSSGIISRIKLGQTGMDASMQANVGSCGC